MAVFLLLLQLIYDRGTEAKRAPPVVETMQSSGRVVKRLNIKLPSYINTPCNRPVYMRTTFSSYLEKMKIFGLLVFFRTFFLVSCHPQDSASESLHPKERWMLSATPDQIELVKSSRGRFFKTRYLPYLHILIT